jgi:hypothetical protein
VERPIGAAVLTIIGGFFILIGGLIWAVVGALFFAFLGVLAGLFFVGLAIGLLTIVLGGLMIAMPRLHAIWGVLAIVMALLSWPFALGGIFLGFLLALIGGILALLFKPGPPAVVVTNARVVTSPPPPPP